MRFIRCSCCSTPSKGACPEVLCNVLSTAEGVFGPVGILMRTDGSSPSWTPNPACTLDVVARSTPAGDIELSSSTLLFLDNSFEGLVATKKHSTAENHIKFFPVVFGNPTSVLREVHIATRVHHGPSDQIGRSCPTHDRLL